MEVTVEGFYVQPSEFEVESSERLLIWVLGIFLQLLKGTRSCFSEEVRVTGNQDNVKDMESGDLDECRRGCDESASRFSRAHYKGVPPTRRDERQVGWR